MIDLNKERQAFNEWAWESVENANLDGEYRSVADMQFIAWKGCIESKEAEINALQAKIEALEAKLSKYENSMFFSHDFNGDGFKYHDTLEEAKEEAEAALDWYRDRVADGHHVEDDGEFKELCYGIVLASADYNIDDVVTEEHHKNDEWTQYDVGTEILSLDFYEESVKPSQENSHDNSD